MTVWTISAQPGTPGEAAARELATIAGVPLYDREGFAAMAEDLDIEVPALDRIEERFCGRHALGLALASGMGGAAPVRELQLKQALPDLGRRLMSEVARGPCVIAVPAAFAALADHPAALHARLRAPFDWRVEAYRREHLVDRHRAEKELKHADHLQHAWVRMLYHVDAEDDSRYAIVLDASRLSPVRVAEALLGAGGGVASLPAKTGSLG